MSRLVQWLVVFFVVVVLGFVGVAVYREQTRPPDNAVAPPSFEIKLAPSAAHSTKSPPSAAKGATAPGTVQAMRAEVKPPVARKGEKTWPEVEALFARIREARKTDRAAVHDLAQAYEEIASPAFTDSSDVPTHCVELGKWRNELPESPTPLIALAAAHIDWAWQARGGGYAFTVSEEGWNLFHTRIDEARKLLDRAIKLGPKDGEAYYLLLTVGKAESWPDEQMREVFDAGRKVDSLYSPLYEEMAVSLMPRWGGGPGDVERFAAEVAALLPGDDGLELFGTIAYTIQRYECDNPVTLLEGEYDRKLLAMSADVLVKRHPNSPALAQFAALCSLVCQDHDIARRIRPHIGEYDPNYRVFFRKTAFETFCNWSAAETIPSGEDKALFVALAGCSALSFADDPRYLWVGHQVVPSAVALIDTQTGNIELELPHPGGVIVNCVIDSARKLVLFNTYRGLFDGWMLLDLDDPSAEPVAYPAPASVVALALNPSKRQVVWSDGGNVYLHDLTTEEAAPIEIKLQQVREIKFSSDGAKLVVGGEVNWSVLDAATGKELFQLPGRQKRRRDDFVCLKVLDFDEQGRIWAIAQSPAPEQALCLVRYSADRTKPDTLMKNVDSIAALSPDRRLLAAAHPIPARSALQNKGKSSSKPSFSQSNTVWSIEIFNVATAKCVKQLGGHWNLIRELRFSSDGRKLATWANDADLIKIWSLADLAINDSPAAPPAQQNGPATPMESGTR